MLGQLQLHRILDQILNGLLMVNNYNKDNQTKDLLQQSQLIVVIIDGMLH
jgi:hypothetical protein